MYHDGSIKDMEREQRGSRSSEKLIIGGQLTQRPADWKDFLMNNENKSQFAHVMNEVWCSDAFAHKLQNRKIVPVVQGLVYLLEGEDGTTVRKTEIPEIFSDQEETDAQVILYCAYAPKQGYETVRIPSPDSDIFFHLATSCVKIWHQNPLWHWFWEQQKAQRYFQSVKGVWYGQELCTVLMSLHVFTHCNTSTFKGIGKIRPI